MKNFKLHDLLLVRLVRQLIERKKENIFLQNVTPDDFAKKTREWDTGLHHTLGPLNKGGPKGLGVGGVVEGRGKRNTKNM